MLITAADVAAFIGKPDDAPTLALAGQHLPIITAMVRAYTRDRGFTGNEPGDDVAAVIISACARSTVNPKMLTEESTAIDDASFTVRHTVFNGWTLPELAILHRYRKRAQ